MFAAYTVRVPAAAGSSSIRIYNYNVPAALKAWVDHIVRKGLTLGRDGRGLVTGKKATVLLAFGGVYTEARRHEIGILRPSTCG